MGAKFSLSIKANRVDQEPWFLQILEFSNWEERARIFALCKSIHKATDSDLFWRWLSHRLVAEHGVYVPLVAPRTVRGFRQLFRELFLMKDMWVSKEEIGLDDANLATRARTNSAGNKSDRSKIKVFARFRPTQDRVSDENADPSAAAAASSVADVSKAEVTLPLHQRLAMIKISHSLSSNRQALKILTSEGDWFASKWKNITNEASSTLLSSSLSSASSPGSTNLDDDFNRDASTITSLKEQQRLAAMKKGGGGSGSSSSEKITASVQTVDPGSGRVVMIAPDVGLREFNFDGVFPKSTSQPSVYDTVAKRLVVDFINGYNATVLAYGQTGSGKTFSMFGLDEAAIFSGGASSRGIVPRVCEEVLTAIRDRQQSFGIESQVGVSYIEVYGDQVSDLLKLGARCGQSKVAAQRFVLQGAAERSIDSMEDVAEVLRVGAQQKRRAATAMNDRSTRAHSLFILSMRQTCVRTGVVRTSRLFLADLGGSEQVKKSQVEAGNSRLGADANFSVGFEMHDRMREAVYINLGLLALKKCIEALNNNAGYVPYQDSKLTMLLSTGLGGDSKTSVVVCGSMDPIHAGETMATMRFGERCAMVETEARNNANMLAGVLADLDSQIKDLEDAIRLKERWETREEKREDQLAEEGTVEKAAGGIEIKKVIVLVGAESERKQLERLLQRRAEFTGQSPLLLSEEFLPTAAADGSKRKKGSTRARVIGFGKQFAEAYGIGEKFDADAEFQEANTRFADQADEEEVPAVIRARAERLAQKRRERGVGGGDEGVGVGGGEGGGVGGVAGGGEGGGKQGKGKSSSSSSLLQWTSGSALENDPKKLEERAKKANRGKLVYAGISA